MKPRAVLIAACAGLAVVLAACTSSGGHVPPAAGDQAGRHGMVITVGSFDFPESVLLAEIYGQALAAGKFPVRILANLGTREVVDPALVDGLLQLVPEYAGSALEFFSLGRLSATSDAGAANRALARSVEGRGLLAARPAPAQDANAIVVTAATAARYGLRSITDLAKVAPRLAFGGPPECPGRAYCLPGLKRVYGLRFKAFSPLDAGGPLTLQALAGRVHRRRVAVHHRSGHPSTASGRPGRRSQAAAGREYHSPGAPGCPRPLRPAPARGAQQGVGPAGHRHPACPRRAGRAVGTEPPAGSRQLAARTWADPGGRRRAVNDDIGRMGAGDRPASSPPGAAVHKTRRQRRPTGAPPPLPHPVTITTTAWLLLAVVGLSAAFVASQHTPWLRVEDRASTWMLRQLAGIRTPWLTDLANGIKAAGTGWVPVVGASVVVLTMIFRRWRHLLVFMGSVLFLGIAGNLIYAALSSPRPYGVPIIASWAGYAAGSPPVAVLTIFLMGIVYCLAVPGRPRTYTKIGGCRRRRRVLSRAHVPGCRLPRRCAAQRGVRRGDRGHRVPLLHPERGVPRRVPARPHRARRCDGPAGGGDPPGRARPARAHGDRDQAGRPRVVRGLNPAAAAGRGRPG